MRIIILSLGFVLVAMGCSSVKENPPIDKINPSLGYRYEQIRMVPSQEDPFIILTFSGGGTRAAAFSFGLMEALKDVTYSKDGVEHRFLDNVEIISSVSGGSFTSAYYALFPGRFFTDFPGLVLEKNIQGDLIGMLFNPVNLVRLMSPRFSRIDLADEYYSKKIFQDKTYADLIAHPKGKVPFIVLNATNISINHRFEFTQDQFDLLCSDLSPVNVSRAVAASSNFPVAFAPLTLTNHKRDCGPLPDWVYNYAGKKGDPKRRIAEANLALSYRDPDRKHVHLLDGGLSDNLGLRGPFLAVTSNVTPYSVLKYANRLHVENLFVIAANAKTTKHRSWDQKASPPGTKSVLGVVTSGPMDDVSFDSVEMVSKHFKEMKQVRNTVDACNHKIQEAVDNCRQAGGLPCPDPETLDNPVKTRFTFSELTFDDIDDPLLRVCLQELPTSFVLPKKTTELLREAAGHLLMASKDFKKGMKLLDPAWEPKDVVIDPELVREVCGTP